jgi:hypothetical protein
MIFAAVVLTALASALTALAIENPFPPSPLGDGTFTADDPLVGRCLGLLNLFSSGADPLDSSDVPLLVAAGTSAAAAIVALRVAVARR